MRAFKVEGGAGWIASVEVREGDDYKGRYGLVMTPEEGGSDQRVELVDIRWNSERTAERTLKTMSVVELRRRYRTAAGRKVGKGLSRGP